MKYIELEKIYYQSGLAQVEAEYKNRINNPCSYKTNLFINPFNKKRKDISKEYPLFFLYTHKMTMLIDIIQSNSREIIKLKNNLPAIATNSFLISLMISEIEKTNKIEGVSSTKKEIFDEIEKSSKVTHLTGIVNRYKDLLNKDNKIPLKKSEDVRNLYDKIFFKNFLSEENKELDGELFRKEAVFIKDGLNRIIHSGESNEIKIIQKMESLIQFMNNKEIPFLIKGAITHYFIEYIHPFYDGNGRFGRFLFSNYLIKKLDPDNLTGFSFSYGVNEKKKLYLESFKNTSKLNNFGEITFFIENILEIISIGQKYVIETLDSNIIKLEFYNKKLNSVTDLDNDEKEILYMILQKHIFDFEEDVTIKDLKEDKNISDYKARIYLQRLQEKGYITCVGKKPFKYILNNKFL